MAELREKQMDNPVTGTGSGDIRGSLSIPKDLSTLGDTTPDPLPEKEVSTKTDSAPPPPPPRTLRVPLATEESFDQTQDEIDTGSLDKILNAVPIIKHPILKEKTMPTKHRFHGGKPPVEMILIDRSNRQCKKLRIDQHMNVLPYEGSGGHKRALCGVVAFCILVFVMTLVIIFAKRNHVNQHDEITSLAQSLDLVAEGAHPVHVRGWNAWEISTSRHKSRAERDLGGDVVTYILLRDRYDNLRLRTTDDFVVTFHKGCQINVHVDVYHGPLLTNSSTIHLGDPTHPLVPEGTLLTAQYRVPEGLAPHGAVLVHFEVGFDGLRSYSLVSVQSRQGILSHIVYGIDPEVIRQLSPPVVETLNCTQTGNC